MSAHAPQYSDENVFLLTGFDGAEPTADNAKVFGSYGPTLEDGIARVLANNPNFRLSGVLSLADLKNHTEFLEQIKAGANQNAVE